MAKTTKRSSKAPEHLKFTAAPHPASADTDQVYEASYRLEALIQMAECAGDCRLEFLTGDQLAYLLAPIREKLDQALACQ